MPKTLFKIPFKVEHLKRGVLNFQASRLLPQPKTHSLTSGCRGNQRDIVADELWDAEVVPAASELLDSLTSPVRPTRPR